MILSVLVTFFHGFFLLLFCCGPLLPEERKKVRQAKNALDDDAIGMDSSHPNAFPGNLGDGTLRCASFFEGAPVGFSTIASSITIAAKE